MIMSRYGTLDVQEESLPNRRTSVRPRSESKWVKTGFMITSGFWLWPVNRHPLRGEVSRYRASRKEVEQSLHRANSHGQGMAVTRMQMAMAMCAIANKGCLMRPMLVDRSGGRASQRDRQYTPQKVRQVDQREPPRSRWSRAEDCGVPEGPRPRRRWNITPWPAKPARRKRPRLAAMSRQIFFFIHRFLPGGQS